MRFDASLLHGVEQGTEPPTLRFFTFKNPTLSFGRLQKLSDIRSLVPPGWETVQRPTGGGIVLHNGDFCFSLTWPKGSLPLPKRTQDQYRWIHEVLLEVLAQDQAVRMAACCDAPKSEEPFATRSCFQNPVGYDLLKDQKKIVGGALRCTRTATLYQGSLQAPVSVEFVERLSLAFKTRLELNS